MKTILKYLFFLAILALVLYALYLGGNDILEKAGNFVPSELVEKIPDVKIVLGREVETPVIPEGPLVPITPVPEGGEGQMPTIVAALPTPQTRYRLGNTLALKQYLQSYMSEGATSEILVPASLDTVGVGWYCENLKVSVVKWNLPWSTYGSIQTQYSTLYAGVPLSAIVDNMDIVGVNERIVEQNSEFIDYGNDAKITIRVPIGLLTAGFRPGNSWKYTLQEPGKYYRAVTDPLRELITGDQVLAKLRDKVDNRSRLAAELDAITPLQVNWSRSTEYLDKLYDLSVTSLNNPGTPDSRTVYDSIWQFAELAAKDAGFQGLESLTIEVEKPETWVYIESLTPVIDPALDVQLAESACPEFSPPEDWLDILLNQ